MVTISKVIERTTKEGKVFVVLELLGDAELIQSQKTGKFYLTAKKCTMPSTFDLLTAQSMVGQKMPGQIKRVASEHYEYTVKETGEILVLGHSYEYCPQESVTQQQSAVNQTFS
ncbi:MAG: hypothetical protein ACTHMC_18485 [Pseudobacter sp.]|uniref:hypothetical protein n=1 Tax=Pseudobacter sp. TaxID=2045420 RepID=UPI003F8186A0